MMLSPAITHRTTGLPLSLPMDTPHATDVVVSAVLSQDILDLGMGMDMVSEVSAEVLVFTQPDLFMSPDLPKDLASAVLSQAILVMALPPMAMLGGVSTGVGLHPTGSVYESRSAQGLGKRSADPGYLGYGLAPYGYAIGGVSTGVGLH